MRAGTCTIQQALTAEADAILKLSLNLARRRGHAQVTPLHVADTLLNSSSSASSLLRRACIRSHPHHPTSLPLQCRALELCFNVALNRLPTSFPPSSSSSLLHSYPSLSNALIAALKRAQAHQRRGCIESQNNHSHQSQQQSNSNQPLLAIKVELEQLIISILDDPSVSRVMREAGFSSTSVKQNLEENSTAGTGMTAYSKPLSFSNNRASFFPTQYIKQIEWKEEDVRVILEVMMRRKRQHQQQSKRMSNTVVVGDSASIAEGVVDELLTRLERGDVPEEMRGVQVIKLHLSYVHLRLMSRIDVEMKISDLRRRVLSSLEKGVVVYAGDLRWAVGDEDRDGVALTGFRPAEYFITEIGSFMSGLKSGINGEGGGGGMVWLLAFSSYQTYIRCGLMNPSLQLQWAIKAVVVPSGGLALSLHTPSGMDSEVPKLKLYHHSEMWEHNRPCNAGEEEEKLICCAECVINYEKDAASVWKTESKDAIIGSKHLPCWLQNKKQEKLYKENLFELRRKWNRLCLSLHQPRISQVQVPPLIGKTCPWWSNSLPSTKSKLSLELSSTSLTANNRDRDISKKWSLGENPKLSRKPITTTLARSSPMFTDTATSTNNKDTSPVSSRDLTRKLQENIPWQSAMIHLVVDTLLNWTSSEKKGNWIMIHGNDLIAKRRLARVLAESFGSTEGLLHISLTRSPSRCVDLLRSAIGEESKCVFLIEGIECANLEFMKLIKEGIGNGFLMDSCGRVVGLANSIFILSNSTSTETVKTDVCSERVLRMIMKVVEEHPSFAHEQSKGEVYPTRLKKKLKTDKLDLNIAISEHGEGEELSDLTHEVGAGGEEVHLPASAVFNFDTNTKVIDQIAHGFTARLRQVFEETVAGNGGEGRLVVDQDLAEELAAASGFFLEVEFARWIRDVFKICIPTVKNGGTVKLGKVGKEGNSVGLGFLGSALPKKIIVNCLSYM